MPFFLSGAAALIYEVVWTRALSLVLGSTVYALSTMLATFMAGLAAGGYLGGKCADRTGNLIFLFGVFELGIGAFGLISIPITYSLPPFYFWIYKTFHLMPVIFFSVQFSICFLIMIIPTTLMGATFPVVSKSLTEKIDEMGRQVGNAYSINTVGAMLGSLVAGFLLMPLLGIKMSSFVAAGLNILMGTVLVITSGHSMRKKTIILSLIIFSINVTFALNTDIYSRVGSFYYASRFKSYKELKQHEEALKIVYEKDHSEGTVKAFQDGTHLAIQHGGKFEGTSPSDFTNTISSVVIPIAAYQGMPDEILVIGLGAGVSAWAARQVAKNVDVIEINTGIIEAVKRFGINDTLKDVTVYVDDARRQLFLSEKKYDIITAEPSVPSESTSANLYTKEFYEIAFERLKPHGIFCQWFPGWATTRRDARICIKTFASVFQDTFLWHIPISDDFIMIGSNRPIIFNSQEIIQRGKPLWEFLTHVYARGQTMDDLFSSLRLVADPFRIRQIFEMQNIPVMTDDTPYLEFAVTKNLLYGPEFKESRE